MQAAGTATQNDSGLHAEKRHHRAARCCRWDSLRSHNGLTVTKTPEKGRRQIYSAKYSDFVVVQSPKM